MRLVDALNDLVNGFDSGLAKGVDVSVGDLSEVDSAPDAVLDVVGLSAPLVRLQQCALSQNNAAAVLIAKFSSYVRLRRISITPTLTT